MSARDRILARFQWIDGHSDLWSVFSEGSGLAAVVRELADPFRRADVHAVCGVESRGFLLGGAVAVALGVGFVAVRKRDGLFPGAKVVRVAGRDYRGVRHALRMRRDLVNPGQRVLFVDDWVETGSQAVAVRDMILSRDGVWAGVSVIVDQLDQVSRSTLAPVRSLLAAHELPAVSN